MAAKRTANLELNHDNWDDEMPTEEAGTFKCASEDELGRRVLKKAKRRVAGDNDDASKVANKTFAGLKGFCSSATLSADYKQPFSFLSGQKQSGGDAQSIVNGLKNGSLSSNNNSGIIDVGGGSEKNSEPNTSSQPQPGTSVIQAAAAPSFQPQPPPRPQAVNFQKSIAKTMQAKGEARAEYYRQLRSLNEGVLAWIKQHVDKNAYCILSPIFIDYDRHVRELDKKYKASCLSGDSTTSFSPSSSSSLSTRSPRISGPVKPIVSTTPSTTSSDLPTTATTVSTIKSELGLNNSINIVPSTTMVDEEQTYEPPKNEVQEVKEEDAFYAIRCKLFYKKDLNYVEKGVGTLYLKSTVDHKTQLLIRAETNLGNVLLNILLTTNVPTARMGPNNVSLVCVPNPPLDLKSGSAQAVSFLLRVKTSEDADELLLKLNESKA